MQIARSFDAITQNKIVRGAFIALAGGASLSLINYLQVVEISNPALASFVVWIAPTLVNIIKEWMAGEKI
jgi:hypothetical protein